MSANQNPLFALSITALFLVTSLPVIVDAQPPDEDLPEVVLLHATVTTRGQVAADMHRNEQGLRITPRGSPGQQTLLVEAAWINASIPDAMATRAYGLREYEGKSWFAFDVAGRGRTPVEWSTFQPAIGNQGFGLGSLASVQLERPMFIEVLATQNVIAGYENACHDANATICDVNGTTDHVPAFPGHRLFA